MIGGKVEFMTPNPHTVYFHDLKSMDFTPTKQLTVHFHEQGKNKKI